MLASSPLVEVTLRYLKHICFHRLFVIQPELREIVLEYHLLGQKLPGHNFIVSN